MDTVQRYTLFFNFRTKKQKSWQKKPETVLDWAGGVVEPLAVGGVEMGREAVEDHLVVVVEPCALVVGEECDVDGCGVDGTERERLELEEAAEFGFHIRLDKQDILDADAKTTFEIDTGLVGDGHTGMKGRRAVFHANLMRAFVDVQVGTDAMTCAVEEIETAFP